MRRTVLVLVLGLIGATGLSGCSPEDTEAVYWRITPGNTPVKSRQVELARGEGLGKVVPTRLAEQMGDLPPRAAGTRRYAAVFVGCRLKAPRILVEDGRIKVVAPKDEAPLECFQAEYYVAVFDVPR